MPQMWKDFIWAGKTKKHEKTRPWEQSELTYKEYPKSSYTLGRYWSFLSHNGYTKKCKSQPTQIGMRTRWPMGNHFHCELIATLLFFFLLLFFLITDWVFGIDCGTFCDTVLKMTTDCFSIGLNKIKHTNLLPLDNPTRKMKHLTRTKKKLTQPTNLITTWMGQQKRV